MATTPATQAPPATAAAPAATIPAAAQTAAVEQAPKKTTAKLFIGNLSSNLQAADITKELEEATHTKVVSAEIISRGGRSPNFGFFEVENEQAAQAAIAALHKKVIDGQAISVEVSKSAGPGSRRRNFPRGPGGFYRGPQMPMMGAMSMQQPMPPMQQGFYPPRRGFYGMNRPPMQQPMMQQPMQQMPPMGGFRRFPPRRAPQDRTPSKTTLYVGNLPYVVTDENLKEIFADSNIKEAHVVRHLNGMSKGFGFVEFATEQEMRTALQSFERVEVEGQVLTITPAVSKPVERRAPFFNAPAATTTTAAPKATEPPKTAAVAK